MRLDARARQDVAILGSGFLKLDGKFCNSRFSIQDLVLSHLIYLLGLSCSSGKRRYRENRP